MIETNSRDTRTNGIARIGSQPIALAAGALVVILLGVGQVTFAGLALSLGLTAAILAAGIVLYQRMARTFVDTV